MKHFLPLADKQVQVVIYENQLWRVTPQIEAVLNAQFGADNWTVVIVDQGMSACQIRWLVRALDDRVVVFASSVARVLSKIGLRIIQRLKSDSAGPAGFWVLHNGLNQSGSWELRGFNVA